MSKRSNTWQKATALIPLALLSGAWTASLAVSANASGENGGQLPDGSSLPSEAIQAPASVSRCGRDRPWRPGRHRPPGRLIGFHQRHSGRGSRGVPACSSGHQRRRPRLQDRLDADRGHRSRRVRPRSLRRQRPLDRGRLLAWHLRHPAGRHPRHPEDL